MLLQMNHTNYSQDQVFQIAKLMYEVFYRKVEHLWLHTQDCDLAIQILMKSMRLDQLITIVKDQEVIALASYETAENPHFLFFETKVLIDYLGPDKGKQLGQRYQDMITTDEAFDKNKYYLDRLIVKEGLRGQGVGRQLLEVNESLAKDMGKTCIELTVVDWNLRAKKFYERYGYQTVGKEYPKDSFKEDALKAGYTYKYIMHKEL